MKNTLAVLALAALPAPAAWAADTWKVDPKHSEASFQVRHFVTHVRGRFGDFEGTILTDAARPENSSVEFKVKAASIDTSVPERDKHLRSPDFFDAEHHPEILFRSTSVKPTGQDVYEVKGQLSMRGVTQEIVLPVTFLGTADDPWGNRRAGFETSVTLNRKDYGINWNKVLDQGGVMLGDDVKVTINIEAVKQTPPGPGAQP